MKKEVWFSILFLGSLGSVAIITGEDIMVTLQLLLIFGIVCAVCLIQRWTDIRIDHGSQSSSRYPKPHWYKGVLLTTDEHGNFGRKV